MIFISGLHILADVAAIVTAIAALWAYLNYRLEGYRKRRRLEQYLEVMRSISCWRVTPLEAAVAVGMTEAEVMNAAYRSKLIERQTTPDTAEAPARIVLKYVDDDESLTRRRRGRRSVF